jgi:hypothetical protein
LLNEVAPAALLSSYYGRDKAKIEEDADNIMEQLTFASVLEGTGGLSGQTIVLAQRLQQGK